MMKILHTSDYAQNYELVYFEIVSHDCMQLLPHLWINLEPNPQVT